MNENGSKNAEIGLYRHRISGQFIGAVDETQANAFVHQGFDLFESGLEAANTSQERLESLVNEDPALVQDESPKKGKK